MTVEVRPIGEKCNIKCVYCYQEGIRAAGNVESRYSIEAMIDRLDRLGERFTLFGGEIMMVPDRDLERLFAYGLSAHGGCGLQTNGTLVAPHHVDLFERYHVRIGVSIDGPGALNDARWAGSDAVTRQGTAHTEGLIETLARRGNPPSVIVTLHQANASAGRLPVLCDWLRFLDVVGVRRVRLHVLEVDSADVGAGLMLDPVEALDVMRTLRALERDLAGLRFDVFDEVAAMLRADDAHASCIFQLCDPYATRAVIGVEGDGRLTNCGRTYKDGVGYLKTERPAYARQLSLYRTPQAEGGCQGCRFFLTCKGNCPGMAQGGDWRRRTADCHLWFGLFEDAEAMVLGEGTIPLSLAPERPAMERLAIEAWSAGLNPTLATLQTMATTPADNVA